MSDSGDACDVVQEVFLKVFRGVNQFRGQSTVKTWIYRIAINEAHNRRRWLFRHRPNSVGLEENGADDQIFERPLEDGGPSPFQIAFNSERQALIEQALADINPDFPGSPGAPGDRGLQLRGDRGNFTDLARDREIEDSAGP